jgi:hypothetical protein
VKRWLGMNCFNLNPPSDDSGRIVCTNERQLKGKVDLADPLSSVNKKGWVIFRTWWRKEKRTVVEYGRRDPRWSNSEERRVTI